MTETLITSFSPPSVHHIDIPLVLSGVTVTIPASSLVYNNNTYSMSLDEVHTAGSYAVDVTIDGYLVLDTSNSNALRVFVDEFVHDGVDVPYDFDSSPYELITNLYQFTVPPGTTDLSTLNWYRWVIVPEP